MSSQPSRFARLAAVVLGKGTDVHPPPPSPDARAAAIAAIERAIRAKARRRRFVRSAVGIAVAAAITAGVFGASRTSSWGRARGPVATRAAEGPARTPEAALHAGAPVEVIAHASGEGASIEGGTPSTGGGQALAPGARVSALPHGSAVLSFTTGTTVKVEEGGDVVLVEEGASQVLALRGGALRADVAKLAAGERFVVRTEDAEVEVHGTSFRVATVPADPDCGGGTSTRVVVYEGVVAVRRPSLDGHEGTATVEAEDRVRAGEVWPRGCAPSASSTPVTASARPAVKRAGDGIARAADARPNDLGASSAPSDTKRALSHDAPVSTELARQNDMFAAAVAAKRDGNTRTALARFDAFLAAYPACPLAESAAVERMRILRDIDAARARDAALAYRAQYPAGFARAEADTIAAEER